MNMKIYLSKILKDLAQEFRIPKPIEKRVYNKLFKINKNKIKTIAEKRENGTDDD